MSAPQEIIELVDRFDRNKEAYQSGQYNETQLRREFLDPFFESLGWDIYNKQGYAEAYKDVIHEDALKIGGATKAPDYCFRVGGTRKFFVEAKKPAVKLKEEISPAFQLRRYAWSAKLPLSILSDFDEFAVYDCRLKPVKTDIASTARIKYLTYSEYIDNWDELTAIFSRDAVLKGSFDKYIETTKGKKGTAEVDDAFLTEIELWRDMLARNIAIRNPELTQRELNFAVQRTIDRLIFLRICEDRGIELYGRLQSLMNGDRIYPRVCEIYHRADERYNSGLFHFSKEKDRAESPDELTLNLAIDDKPLKEIIKNLYYPDSPYEFAVLPADILGQVYEQFLGKVIRLTAGHRAVVEDKPEVKKAGGVYYTPSYIVEYIVKNTVGKLVDGKTSKEVAKLRILDPACGSGSFLINAYQFLLDWHRDWYLNDGTEKHKKELYQISAQEWRLTTAERKRILLNNIYGVDIDPQAVEVTKLSLLLKVLEGESEETVTAQLRLFHQRALPDLGNNIKCGNSLIGTDFYANQQMSLLDEDEKYRINVFDWEKEFPEIFQTPQNRRDTENTKDNTGFDAVIGNPPYVLIEESKEKDYLQLKYKLSTGKPDLYRYFIEKSHEILKKGGLFGFIIPNSVLTIPGCKNLREYLLCDGGLVKIVNFWGRVFEKASINNVMIFTQKYSEVSEIDIIDDQSEIPNATTLLEAEKRINSVEKKTWLNNEQFQFYISSSIDFDKLISKIRTCSVELSSVAKYTLGMQVYHNSMHSNEHIKQRVYHAKNKKDETFWPESGGNNIQRYNFIENFKEYVSYGEWCYNKPPWEFCSKPRILIREIPSKTLVCTFSNGIHIPKKAVIIIIPERVDFNYLLGILNSKLIGYYVATIGEKGSQRLFPRVSLTTVRKLPIRVINFSEPSEKAKHDRMVELVDQMLTLHKQLASTKTPDEQTVLQRQIDATDHQIDRLVYELYGLTEDEIKIVETRS
ncbi:MAG: N-6 DNA methylase [bacterium]|nr:N-6 DNA methylase [bacterium]